MVEQVPLELVKGLEILPFSGTEKDGWNVGWREKGSWSIASVSIEAGANKMVIRR